MMIGASGGWCTRVVTWLVLACNRDIHISQSMVTLSDMIMI